MNEKNLNDQTRELTIPPPPETRQGHWYLLTGLVLGVIIGLIFSWLIWPVVYEHTAPKNLSEPYKEIYRGTIARVYAVTGDLERAISRLDLLEDEDIVHSLGAQAQQTLADGRTEEARSLALLASAIQGALLPEPAQTSTASPDEVLVPTQTLPQITTYP